MRWSNSRLSNQLRFAGMKRQTRHQWQADGAPDDCGQRRASRSEKKRRADRLTRLGVKLTQLNPKILAGLEMDDELREAIVACRELKPGNARVRQGRLIGKLLRQHDRSELIDGLSRLGGDARDRAALARVKEDQRGAKQDPDKRISKLS